MFCQIVIRILVLFGNRFEILGYFYKGIHHIGIEMCTFTLQDDIHRLFSRLLGARRSRADPPGLDRGAAVADELLDRTHIPLDNPIVDVGNA